MNNYFRKLFRGRGNSQPDPTPAAQAKTEGEVNLLLASPIETAESFYPGHPSADLLRSRFDYDRQGLLAGCLRAWRVNPLARRVVSLQTDFIIGGGLGIHSDHKATHKFLLDWWNHPLNNLDAQIPDWCDELARAGDLFLLFSLNPLDGMTYLRPIPAEQVREIHCADNDIHQELAYLPADLNAEPWPAYDGSGEQTSFVLHFAVNRPVGSAWGEPMLAPLLETLGRYHTWLEDRARLNHFRSAFMYVVQGKYASEQERTARENHIRAHPPTPGSVLVVTESEKWSTLSAQLDSADASLDGLSLKKTIAAGAGIPLHYLAEPESATRTTADAAGTPTFRSLERTQKSFIAFLERMALTAAECRKRHDRRLNLKARLRVLSPDITERDNSLLSLAAARIHPPVMDLFDRGLIPSAEALRLIYRMAGETLDDSAPVPPGRRRRIATQPELPFPKSTAGDEEDDIPS